MKEKVALITGASSGIGRACALLFAENNVKVVAVGRNEKELNSLRNEAQEKGDTFKIVLADISDVRQIDKLVDDVAETFGRIDILINAAGIIGNGSVETTALDEWDRMLNINLRSIFYLMQKCVPLLEKSEGNIVNVSSVTGLRAFPGVLAYCVSKAGVDQLTRCSALELAPKGIRVNAVNPGVVKQTCINKAGWKTKNIKLFWNIRKRPILWGESEKPTK